MTTRALVIVNLTINTEAWCAEFGVKPSEAEADVKAYVGETIRAHLHSLDLLEES